MLNFILFSFDQPSLTLQMFDWIYSNREAFLSNYVEIGRNHVAAKKLQEEHNQFTVASNVSI